MLLHCYFFYSWKNKRVNSKNSLTVRIPCLYCNIPYNGLISTWLHFDKFLISWYFLHFHLHICNETMVMNMLKSKQQFILMCEIAMHDCRCAGLVIHIYQLKTGSSHNANFITTSVVMTKLASWQLSVFIWCDSCCEWLGYTVVLNSHGHYAPVPYITGNWEFLWCQLCQHQSVDDKFGIMATLNFHRMWYL